MDPIQLVIGGLAGVVLGASAGWAFHRWQVGRRIGSAERRAEELVEESRRKAADEARKARKETKDDVREQQKRFDQDVSRRRKEMDRAEEKLNKREGSFDKRLEQIDKREQGLERKERTAEGKDKEADELLEQRRQQLQEATAQCEHVSGMTADEAKEVLLANLKEDVEQDAAALIRRVENEARESAAKKARQIITLAIQKYAAEQVSETTVSVVNLPGDEAKGRIIGREGRNIRALEAATGCNIIVDDTPEAVVLSCFDALRREVARLSLEKLLADGRIHPGRIEEVVQKTEKEVNQRIRELGEESAFDLGIHGLHPELIRLIGRLKYRTSYGQNVLKHSMEVAYVAKVMAAELGVDEQIAKRAGVLHDIGKAVSYEMEGTHAKIGADLARKYGETPAVIHAIGAHHAEEEPRTIIAVLVQAADAISAARPGARRETIETYIKRLKQLESIADSFDGVKQCYAIQAGREVRILVDPGRLNDNESAKLARDVTKKVEAELEYPGQIKVTVLREVRATEYAK